MKKDQAEAIVGLFRHAEMKDAIHKDEFYSYKSDMKEYFAKMHQLILEAKVDLLKWMLPLIFGLYGPIIFKLFWALASRLPNCPCDKFGFVLYRQTASPL